MREALHADDDIGVFLIIDEDEDRAWLELQSSESGPDLSVDDDVIVFLDDRSLDVEAEDARHARVELGDASRLESTARLTLRAGEFFEGWEFGIDEDRE